MRSEEDLLHEGEHVGGAEDDSQSCGGGPAAAYAGEGAGEDEEFSDEAVEHGQADHGETGDDEERGEGGGFLGEATVLADLAGSEAVVEDTEEDEERGADDAFVEGLEDAAVETGGGEAVDTEGAEAEAADGAVGEELPEVFLDEGQQCAV